MSDYISTLQEAVDCLQWALNHPTDADAQIRKALLLIACYPGQLTRTLAATPERASQQEASHEHQNVSTLRRGLVERQVPVEDSANISTVRQQKEVAERASQQQPEGWAIEIRLSHYHDGTRDEHASHYCGSFTKSEAEAAYEHLHDLLTAVAYLQKTIDGLRASAPGAPTDV
jgi:hypothetical protein